MTESIEIGGSDTAAPHNTARRIGMILRWVDLDGLRILDAGCGAGALVEALAAHGAVASGIEYQADKIEEWQLKNPGDTRVEFGDLAGLSFEEGAFDAVLNNEVLEHVPDDALALREMNRVLKSEGTLFLFTPNRLYPVETHGVIVRLTGEHISGLRVPFLPWLPERMARRKYRAWVRNYWPSELAAMVRAAGFDIQHHGYVWQTFENISGGKRRLVHSFAPLARAIAGAAQRTPFLRAFGVSQFIVAKKRAA